MVHPRTPPPDDAPHLLLVDDDRRIRELLSRYLSDHGYRVTTANSRKPKRASRLGGIAFDLLVLDVMMPGESGLDLARSIRNGLDRADPDAHRARRRRGPHRGTIDRRR